MLFYVFLFSSRDIWLPVLYEGNILEDATCPFSGCQLADYNFPLRAGVEPVLHSSTNGRQATLDIPV